MANIGTPSIMGRFSKETVDIVSEHLLQSEGHAARRSSNSARYVNKDRMVFVHLYLQAFELLNYTLCRNGIAQEQICRPLVIDKMACRLL